MSRSSQDTEWEKSVAFFKVLTGASRAESERIFVESLASTYSEEDIDLIFEHLDDHTIQECLEIVRKAMEEHDDDPSLPKEYLQKLRALAESEYDEEHDVTWETRLKFEAFIIHEWSIYEEVRSVTRPIDEPDGEGYENWRMYTIAIIWSCAGSAINTFFEPRLPRIGIGASSLQVLIAYSGHAWALLVPQFSHNKRLRWLNPGPWTFKEQLLCVMSMSIAAGAPYSQHTVIAQANEHFFGLEDAQSVGYILMLTLSSTLMGMGLAGLTRSFLVYPTRCIWFSCLPGILMTRSLSQRDPRELINGWFLRRSEFFWLFAGIFFVWYWLTNFVCQAMSYFTWMTWIAPTNTHLQALTGFQNGLGLNPISTLDPTNFGFTTIVQPWLVTNNAIAGMALGTVAVIVIWYTNVRWTAHLPINSNLLWARDGSHFKVREILNDRLQLDEAKYQKYSLPFWSAGNLVNYGVFFACYPALVVYAVLNYGSLFMRSLRSFRASLGPATAGRALDHFDDRFSRTQRRYPEVPEWWFFLVLAGSLGMAVATVEVYRFTETPIWTLFFGLGLSLLFLLPSGYLMAIANTGLTVNVLFELVIGYAIPGNAMGLMVSKTYCTNCLMQTDGYLENLVQAHYCGIAPRALFRSQLVVSVINVFVQTALIKWQVSGSIPDICSMENPLKFLCMSERTFFNAAVQWGTLGPRRVFQGLYSDLRWCFLLGVFYPLPFWLMRRYGTWIRLQSKASSESWIGWALDANYLRNINELVILTGAMGFAPGPWFYKWGAWYIGAVFMMYIRPRFPRWWGKFAYLLPPALSTGAGFAALIQFFSTGYYHFVRLNWPPNTIPFANNDYRGQNLERLPVPTIGYFGPIPGTFP